jgi:hypothetical protein
MAAACAGSGTEMYGSGTPLPRLGGDMLVIAYRDVSFYAPENLMVVFILALWREATYTVADNRQFDGSN